MSLKLLCLCESVREGGRGCVFVCLFVCVYDRMCLSVVTSHPSQNECILISNNVYHDTVLLCCEKAKQSSTVEMKRPSDPGLVCYSWHVGTGLLSRLDFSVSKYLYQVLSCQE